MIDPGVLSEVNGNSTEVELTESEFSLGITAGIETAIFASESNSIGCSKVELPFTETLVVFPEAFASGFTGESS